MGCTAGSDSSLKVGTLNFSGICISPFQYHDLSIEKDFLSSKFQQLLKLDLKKNDEKIKFHQFKWKTGKIDQIFQKQRYTPIYNKRAGVEKGKLLSEQQFSEYWEEYFSKISKSDLKNYNITDQQKKSCKRFDLLCYKTLVYVVYYEAMKEGFHLDKARAMKVTKYLEYLDQWHSKPYLDNSKKIKLVQRYIKDNDFDIFFMQEAKLNQSDAWQKVMGDSYEVVRHKGLDQSTKNLKLKQEQSKKNEKDTKTNQQENIIRQSQSVLIYKKQSLPEARDYEFQTLNEKNLNFHKDTVFARLGNLLIISSHLSSKSDKNKKEGTIMFEQFKRIQMQDPRLKIIMGIDANYYLQQQYRKQYDIYPNEQNISTTAKKRTWMQVQTQKSNLISLGCKDFVVTTERIQDGKVTCIEGKEEKTDAYLPNQKHPFDHFIVQGRVFFKVNDDKK